MASKKEQTLPEEEYMTSEEAADAATDAEAVNAAEAEGAAESGETELLSDGVQDPDESLLSAIVGDEADEMLDAPEDSSESDFALTEDTPAESVETVEQDDMGVQAGDEVDGNDENDEAADNPDASDGDEMPAGDAATTESNDEPTGAEEIADGNNEGQGSDPAAQRTRRARGRPPRNRRPTTLSSHQISNERRRRDAVQNHAQREDDQERRDDRNDAWADMQGAMLYGRILRGRVSGVRNLNGRVYAVVIFGGVYLILIPFQSFYVDNPINMSTVDTVTRSGRIDLRQRQTAMLEKHYGYDTPFIITRMERGEGGSYVILGSRSAALNRRAHENFTPGDNGEAVMRPGDIVPAVVTSIAEHSIAVNVGGVDTRIRASDLTFRYVPSGEKILEKYAVGDTIPVMLMDSRRTENGHWTCRVSRRRVEMEEAKARHHLFSTPGDLTSAIVTGKYFREDNGRAYLRLYLDAYDIPAATSNVPKRPNGEYPAIGESYRVAFQDYKEETGVTYVTLRGYHGPARL